MSRDPDPFQDPFFNDASQPPKQAASRGQNDQTSDYYAANPYAAPAPSASEQFLHTQIASRGLRLGGFMLDGLFGLLAFSPGFVAVAIGESSRSSAGEEALAILAALLMLTFICALVGVNWYFISTRGQSLGKMVVGTRIARKEDLGMPGFVRGVILRAWVPGFLMGLPCGLGFIFFLVDSLWITSEDAQCLHDLIANTVVIYADESPHDMFTA